jgi:uncharacterized short protein YbdD (DUF466 family)
MRPGTEAGNEKRETGNVTFPLSRFPLSPLRGIGRALRVIFGMPDYDRYLSHRRACHPDEPVLSPGEHYAEHLRRRYEGGGPSRCC